MNGSSEVVSADETWPPSPTLPPPEQVRPPSFMTLHPVLSRVLVSASSGLFLSALDFLRQWFSHFAHVVDWNGVLISGLTMFLMQMGIHLGIPYMARREKQKREREDVPALEAKALAAQDATE